MLIKNAAISSTSLTDRSDSLAKQSSSLVDVRVLDGRIVAVATKLTPRSVSVVEPQRGEEVIDAKGCALIPGLHDHHMHLLALASALQSVNCEGSEENLAQKIAARCRENPGEIRGINYHPGQRDMIDAIWLDRVCPDIPVRIQHQSGRLWILNSAAIKQINSKEFPEGAERNERRELTGRFYHLDEWLRIHLPRTPPPLGHVSRLLASCGVTGITDAGPDNDDSIAQLLLVAQARGELLQNVLLMGRTELSNFDDLMLKRGPHKLYLKESQLPDFDQLCEAIRHSHAANRPVAFHCTTRVELQVALTALHDCGVHAGDRIEHASVASDDALEQLQNLGITVVSQPHFINERGDRYRAQVDEDDQPFLYRAQSLLKAGIPFAGGTDAPYGHYDPWRSMRAAIERSTPSNLVMGIEERLTSMQALALYTGDSQHPGTKQRKITTGQIADLCLLDTDWNTMLQDLRSEHVQKVWRSGELIFSR